MDPEITINQTNEETRRFLMEIREMDIHDNIVRDIKSKRGLQNPELVRYQKCVDLCDELREAARKKYGDERRRQQIREENHELRQLEVQIRAAYTRKFIEYQMYERKALKDEKQYSKAAASAQLSKSRLNYQETFQKKEAEERARKNAYKNVLKEQMEEARDKRLERYREIQEEKKDMDAFLQRCKEEDEKKKMDLLAKKQDEKRALEEFLRARAEAQAQQALAEQDKTEKIEQIGKKRIQEHKHQLEEKRQQKLRKERIVEAIGRRTYEEEKKISEKREFLEAILIDEKYEMDELRARKELEERHRNSVNMRLQMERERIQKEQSRLSEAEINKKLYEDSMRFLAERDKLEQLSDEKRRRKQMEHRKAIQASFVDRNERRVADMKNLLVLQEMDARAEKAHNEHVKCERLRLLLEHGPALLKYLPPGTITEAEAKVIQTTAKSN